MFFRLIGVLLDLSLPVILIFEVLVPLWSNKSLFPVCRKVAKGVLYRLFATKPHVSGAKTRKRIAEERLAAACEDREAAALEMKSEEIEDETNDIRSRTIK
jgi:hypothetical protein